MDIAENLKLIASELPAHVMLVAVSKTYSEDTIMELYRAGHKIFGENKVQEMTDKYQKLPKDIEWHMIGHLQSNKVKYIAPFVSLIHSVDSISLLESINKEAFKNNRVIDCLIQLKIAREETKYGIKFDEADEILNPNRLKPLHNVRIIGLMGMATFTNDDTIIKQEFSSLACYFKKLKEQYFREKPYFCELSMGMSGDYKHAVAAGSTIVRIGSLIFGDRNYN